MEPSQNHTRHHQHRRQHAKSLTPTEAPFSYRFTDLNYSNYFTKKSHKCTITNDDFKLQELNYYLFTIFLLNAHIRDFISLSARLEIGFISSIMISIKFLIKFKQGLARKSALLHENNAKHKLKPWFRNSLICGRQTK